MGSNRYFNLYHQKQEQSLLNDLVEEAVRIHSIDAIYIPRQASGKLDPLFREDVLSHFDDYHHIEVYIKNVDGFEGENDIFRKFGVEIKNQITFSISRKSFAKVFGREQSRPKEGDLIYIPLSIADALYEIRFVNEDSVFYPLGEFYLYDVRCEQAAFEDENINTGIDIIDEIGDEASELFVLRLDVPSGSGLFEYGETIYQGDSLEDATAKATVVSVELNGTLKIKNLYGEFSSSNGAVVGVKSGASYDLESDDPLTGAVEIVDDFGGKNRDFVVIDFTENNPFSEDGDF
jgi:Virus neck protein